MAGKSDAWMPFYIGHYLRDTMHLTTEQHGAYMLLLMACWTRGGALPSASAQLAGIARMTPAAWRKSEEVVMAFFTLTDGGEYTHGRILAELTKAKVISDKRREVGAKGGRPKKELQPDEKPIAKPIAKQMRSQNETPTPLTLEPDGSNPPVVPQGTKAIVLRQAHVDEAWAVTPPKARGRTSRADVTDALRAAAQRGKRPEDVINGLKAYYASREATRDDGEYAKGAHRIIAKDRWESFVGDAALVANCNAVETEDDRNARWDRRVADYRKAWTWNEVDWGPKPGREGCKAPAWILEKHGYAPKTGDAA